MQGAQWALRAKKHPVYVAERSGGHANKLLWRRPMPPVLILNKGLDGGVSLQVFSGAMSYDCALGGIKKVEGMLEIVGIAA